MKPEPKDRKPEPPVEPPDDYDAAKDLAGSISEGFKAIRERVAAGGKGWEPK